MPSQSDCIGVVIWLAEVGLVVLVTVCTRAAMKERQVVMSREDAETVKHHLEKAQEAAKPLKDAGLDKRLKEVREHVEKRLDHVKED